MEEKIEVQNIENEKENEKEKEKIKEHEQKEVLINVKEDSYKFLLIDANEKFFLIKKLYENKLTEKIQINKNNIEIFAISEKEVDRCNHLMIFDGIIFIYNQEEKDNLNFIINYIFKIEKKIKNKKCLPKIIIGNNIKFQNSLQKSKIKEKNIFNEIKYIKYIKPNPELLINITEAIKLFINMKKINDNYNKFLEVNEIDEKQIINNFSKSKINLMKCLKCNLIYNISISEFSNSIIFHCNNCKSEKKFELLNFKKSFSCNECKKQIKETNLINYCSQCKKYFCSDCSKVHLKKSNSKCNIYANNLIDLFCSIHNKINYNYCSDCKTYICIDCELESHIFHKKKIFQEKKIIDLINAQKKNLRNEKFYYDKIKIYIKDCIKSLNQYFEKLILYKEREMEIKEEMIKAFELFRYDNILFENIKKLKFGSFGTVFYNYKTSFDIKLNTIFEFLKEPLKIKKKKLCKEENLKGPFDNLEQLGINQSLNLAENEEDVEDVTDIVSLHSYMDKNYFAVSFDNGKLKIYNDNFENKRPIKVIKEFDPDEGINSMNKSNGNFLILIGNTKIKKLYLSEDLKQYKVVNEISVTDQIFKMAFEINLIDSLIAVNISNDFIFYNFRDGNQLRGLTKSIQEKRKKEKEKEITYIEKISDNYIITKISNQSDKLILNNSFSENDLSLNKDKYSAVIYKPKEAITLLKIYEFDIKEEKIEIKNQHLFETDISYLGKISDLCLLLFNKKLNVVIIYDLMTYNNILELSFDSFQKPLFSFPLSRRTDLLDLLIICEGEYICQYTLNLKVGILYILSSIKIKESNNKKISLLDSYMINKIEKEENKISEKKIKKIVNFSKNNFIILTQDDLIYNLKISN